VGTVYLTGLTGSHSPAFKMIMLLLFQASRRYNSASMVLQCDLIKLPAGSSSKASDLAYTAQAALLAWPQLVRARHQSRCQAVLKYELKLRMIVSTTGSYGQEAGVGVYVLGSANIISGEHGTVRQQLHCCCFGSWRGAAELHRQQ
jgi:hypothetical protein